ncbi:hypothetical protein RFI_09228 [Reticulomyxa filosa]|uniref:Uncharacterized protein n=1 Tax=Reticulomyxa filosa TaxID=46433 RepID=X6NPS5_RETFI|nr:hypothetical protein RFI_09228 [Reticulomyxa filosa]|eukprot:ETO27903.1 hypothetical protein RFI_09228 [Reticulomyxa filosa]
MKRPSLLQLKNKNIVIDNNSMDEEKKQIESSNTDYKGPAPINVQNRINNAVGGSSKSVPQLSKFNNSSGQLVDRNNIVQKQKRLTNGTDIQTNNQMSTFLQEDKEVE